MLLQVKHGQIEIKQNLVGEDFFHMNMSISNDLHVFPASIVSIVYCVSVIDEQIHVLLVILLVS